jgi:type II secretory pathway pseudopilin PulG
MKSDGFSLIEALIATALVIVVVVSLARLFVISAGVVGTARAVSTAVLLAQQKLEELRAQPVLAASPTGTLSADTPGFADYLDVRGARFTRRWSVEAIPEGGVLVLQVVVSPGGARLVGAKTSVGR